MELFIPVLVVFLFACGCLLAFRATHAIGFVAALRGLSFIASVFLVLTFS